MHPRIATNQATRRTRITRASSVVVIGGGGGGGTRRSSHKERAERSGRKRGQEERNRGWQTGRLLAVASEPAADACGLRPQCDDSLTFSTVTAGHHCTTAPNPPFPPFPFRARVCVSDANDFVERTCRVVVVVVVVVEAEVMGRLGGRKVVNG